MGGEGLQGPLLEREARAAGAPVLAMVGLLCLGPSDLQMIILPLPFCSKKGHFILFAGLTCLSGRWDRGVQLLSVMRVSLVPHLPSALSL
eukprot:COSAG06_NODE_108_length_23594_cov_43.013450_5_plen_90_part_00